MQLGDSKAPDGVHLQVADLLIERFLSSDATTSNPNFISARIFLVVFRSLPRPTCKSFFDLRWDLHLCQAGY